MDAIEKEKERRCFAAAGVSSGGIGGVGGGGGERTSAMAFSERMTESDPFTRDQRLEPAQCPGVRV